LGLTYPVSLNEQQLLNPDGINVLRNLNGRLLVWGARTLGGDANGETKYVNVRRLLNFLRESIDEGTQFAVFEPNAKPLWQRISRTATAFLTNVWRSGALFGETPDQAFYVKCDESTNSSDVREAGQVVTEIGVAIVKPAEFVIFRISQMTGTA
jgi:phage tail sheath protein FI